MNPFDIREMVYEIALRLDSVSLARFYRVATRILALFQNNSFWQNKVECDFGLSSLKPRDITYNQQYHTLHFLPTLDGAIAGRRLDQVVLLYKAGSKPRPEQMEAVVRNGDLSMLNWFVEREILPTSQSYMHAALNVDLNTLDWLLNKGVTFPVDSEETYEVLIYQLDYLLVEVLGMRAVPVLLWMEQGELIVIDDGTADTAAMFGHVELLDWL